MQVKFSSLSKILLLHFAFSISLNAQISFEEYSDTIALPFSAKGLEFINDDLWTVNSNMLVQMSYPELETINQYEIPIEQFAISDISSDGSDYIWLGEGQGAGDGFLHMFDIKEEEFIYSRKITGIANYQIQGLDYYDDELWITNFDPASNNNILRVSIVGSVTGQMDFTGDVMLPMSIKDGFLFTGNRDSLICYDLATMQIVDVHYFESNNTISGLCDVYDNKMWFLRFGMPSTIASIQLNGLFSSTIETESPEIAISPNPASNFIRIKTDTNTDSWSGNIVDVNGKIIQGNLDDLREIDIRHLVPQTYFLVLLTEDKEIYAYPFVKI